MRVRTRSRVSNEICLMPGRCNRAASLVRLNSHKPGTGAIRTNECRETVASAITIRTTGAAGATGRATFSSAARVG